MDLTTTDALGGDCLPLLACQVHLDLTDVREALSTEAGPR